MARSLRTSSFLLFYFILLKPNYHSSWVEISKVLWVKRIIFFSLTARSMGGGFRCLVSKTYCFHSDNGQAWRAVPRVFQLWAKWSVILGYFPLLFQKILGCLRHSSQLGSCRALCRGRTCFASTARERGHIRCVRLVRAPDRLHPLPLCWRVLLSFSRKRCLFPGGRLRD